MTPEPSTIPVLLHDEHLIAVAKPSGLLTHRGWGRDRTTMLELVRALASCYVYPVHRLDRATSGVLLFAKAKDVAQELNELFATRQIDKRYLALVLGAPEAMALDRPLSQDPSGKGQPRREPVPSTTLVRPLWQGPYCALVEAMPLTGRLHQIRRHLFHAGHALVGDRKYGYRAHNRIYKREYGLERLALHAWRLAFVHPRTGASVECVALPPAELRAPFEAVGIPSTFWDSLLETHRTWEGWQELADAVSAKKD